MIPINLNDLVNTINFVCEGTKDDFFSPMALTDSDAKRHELFTFGNEIKCVYRLGEKEYLVKLVRQSEQFINIRYDFATGCTFIIISIKGDVIKSYEDQALIYTLIVRLLLKSYCTRNVTVSEVGFALLGIMYSYKMYMCMDIPKFLDKFDKTNGDREKVKDKMTQMFDEFDDYDFLRHRVVEDILTQFQEDI